MKKIILLAIVLFWVQMVQGQTRTLSLATGPTGGTYARIGEDIKGLVEKEGMGIRLVTSNGSFENIELLAKGEAELAMVQLDALRYFVDVAKAEGGANVFERLKVILNLYPEEIHVLTKQTRDYLILSS
jgi:TRAP transporter TAXI family solute receptor